MIGTAQKRLAVGGAAAAIAVGAAIALFNRPTPAAPARVAVATRAEMVCVTVTPSDATATVTSTPTTTRTLTATPNTTDTTPTAKPSLTPTGVTSAKSPHGLYEIGGDAWTNPNISGWRGELQWASANPSDGTYDWKRIDGLVASSVAYHKQLSVALRMLSSPPPWLVAMPGVKTYTSTQFPDPMILPFDAVAQPKIIAFIKAFCLHFDGKLDYITMGGLGYRVETYMPLPSTIGLTMTIPDYTAAWIGSSNLIIDTYQQNLKSTPFILAGGIPFADPGAAGAITTVINHGLTYPLFGLSQWGLNANSNSGFLINKFIQDNDAGHATGFQMTGASDGSVGGDLKGTLEQALTAGANLGADFIEVYAADAMNSAYTTLLATFNGSLK